MAIFVNGQQVRVAELADETIWEMAGGAPEYRLTESDQADPLGRWRWRLEGDVAYFERALTAEWATDEDWLTFDKANEAVLIGKAMTISSLITFDTGVAITAGSYQVGRDLDGTNQLHLNVPTGASVEISINDVAEVVLDATGLDFASGVVKWSAGLAVVAGDYSIGRDGDGTNQLHLNVPTGASFELSINDVPKLTLDGTVLTIAGGQLAFPATQSASADANTLDDYEEGSFTPAIADDSLDGSGEGQVHTTQVGRYTKIGNQVYFQIYIVTTGIGTLTAGQTVRIVGLPFTSSSVFNLYAAVYVGFAYGLALPTASESVTGFVGNNATNLGLYNWDATAGPSSLLISEWSATGQMILNGHYQV